MTLKNTGKKIRVKRRKGNCQANGAKIITSDNILSYCADDSICFVCRRKINDCIATYFIDFKARHIKGLEIYIEWSKQCVPNILKQSKFFYEFDLRLHIIIKVK